MSLPADATQIVATLTLIQAVADSSDTGQDADGTPLEAATVLFTPATSHVTLGGVLVTVAPVTAYTDASGVLYNPGATVAAGASAAAADIGVHLLAGIAWTAQISHTSMASPIGATIPATATGTINLATLVN